MRNKEFREGYQIKEKNEDYGYIKQFEKCPYIPNYTTIIGSTRWGETLGYITSGRDTYRGVIVSGRKEEMFYVTKDYDDIFVAMKNILYIITRKSNNITKYFWLSELDEYNGFTTVGEANADLNDNIKEIRFRKYDSSRHNIYEDNENGYSIPDYRTCYISIFDKALIDENIANKLYGNAPNALEYIEGYYIIKGVSIGNYGVSSSPKMIEHYSYDNEYPDKIYIGCSGKNSNNLYSAIGRGWYVGENDKMIRIEKIREHLKESGFDISDDLIKKMQIDFEQGVSIPKSVIRIARMYEKVITKSQKTQIQQ